MAKKKHPQLQKVTPKSIERKKNKTVLIILFGLLLITTLSYFNSLPNQFLASRGDTHLIVENPTMKKDLAGATIDFFKTSYQNNYQPLTMMFYYFDFNFWKNNNARTFHSSNLLLHLLNILLVFTFIFQLCKSYSATSITTLFFAIHPLHSEAVLSISARSILLSTTFILLGLLFYLYFTNNGNKVKNLIFSGIFMLLASLSSIIAVSFPFLLLAVDVYKKRSFNAKIYIEKLPFFILSALFIVVHFFHSEKTEGIDFAPDFSIIEQFFIGLHSIMLFFTKTIIPMKLSPLHLYPEKLSVNYFMPIVLMGILAFYVLRMKKMRQEFIFGFLFFLLSIIVMLLFQKPSVSPHAERFAYLPNIGLFFIFGILYHFIRNNQIIIHRKLKPLISISYTLLAGIFIFALLQRVKVWNNDLSFLNESIQKNATHPYPFVKRGLFYMSENKNDKAKKDFIRAIKQDSVYGASYYFLGKSYYSENKTDSACQAWSKAVKLGCDSAKIHIENTCK